MWRSLVREFEEMLNGIDKMDRADFWDLGHDMSSFFVSGRPSLYY